MNSHFAMPSYYRRVSDHNRFSQLIEDAGKEDARAVKRLLKYAIRQGNETDSAWNLRNFAPHYAFLHVPLFSYVELMLDNERISGIDLDTFERLYRELSSGSAEFQVEELANWFQQYVDDDVESILSEGERSSRIKTHGVKTIAMYEVYPDLYCVRYKSGGYNLHTYVIEEASGPLLYHIWDGTGRLRDTGGFIFIQ